MANKNQKKDLIPTEDDLQFEDNSNEQPPVDVFAFNELRSCADLYRLYDDKTLKLDPGYQRESVWKDTDQTRFIDSLVKNLPIPSLCFSLNAKTGAMEVIDGRQRMESICRFLGNRPWKLSTLEDIDPKISGKTVEEIKSNTPYIYEKVKNVSIPITVVRCNYFEPTHSEYIFTIFRRLNTGGMKLKNQEIRNAIYAGPFNEFLKECNQNLEWERLLSKSMGQSIKDDRFRSLELVLRFFAFYNEGSNYGGRFSKFLNDYMQANRKVSDEEIEEMSFIFNRTISLARREFFKTNSKKRLSSAVLDALLFGIAKNIDYLEGLKATERDRPITKLFEKLLSGPLFKADQLAEGLYQKRKTLERLEFSRKIFAGKY